MEQKAHNYTEHILEQEIRWQPQLHQQALAALPVVYDVERFEDKRRGQHTPRSLSPGPRLKRQSPEIGTWEAVKAMKIRYF
jgi:hypothetical protein